MPLWGTCIYTTRVSVVFLNSVLPLLSLEHESSRCETSMCPMVYINVIVYESRFWRTQKKRKEGEKNDRGIVWRSVVTSNMTSAGEGWSVICLFILCWFILQKRLKSRTQCGLVSLLASIEMHTDVLLYEGYYTGMCKHARGQIAWKLCYVMFANLLGFTAPLMLFEPLNHTPYPSELHTTVGHSSVIMQMCALQDAPMRFKCLE